MYDFIYLRNDCRNFRKGTDHEICLIVDLKLRQKRTSWLSVCMLILMLNPWMMLIKIKVVKC